MLNPLFSACTCGLKLIAVYFSCISTALLVQLLSIYSKILTATSERYSWYKILDTFFFLAIEFHNLCNFFLLPPLLVMSNVKCEQKSFFLSIRGHQTDDIFCSSLPWTCSSRGLFIFKKQFNMMSSLTSQWCSCFFELRENPVRSETYKINAVWKFKENCYCIALWSKISPRK